MFNFDFHPLVIAIIVTNVIVFIYQSVLPHKAVQIIERFGVLRHEIQSGEWYRLLTSGFVHADILHLVLNQYSLFVIAPSVLFILATVIGFQFAAVGFLVLYLLGIIAGGLFSMSKRDFDVPSVGASGGIFGLLGFLLCFGLLTFGQGGSSIVQSIVFVLLINFGIGLMPGSQIDNRGHLGGLVSGVITGLVVVAIGVIS